MKRLLLWTLLSMLIGVQVFTGLFQAEEQIDNDTLKIRVMGLSKPAVGYIKSIHNVEIVTDRYAPLLKVKGNPDQITIIRALNAIAYFK